MAATIIAEIHFHQQDHVSVYLESAVSGRLQEIAEIHLFVLFALRQMYNLGSRPTADELAAILSTTSGLIEEMASGREYGGVRLTQYPGAPGRKQFLLYVTVRDDGTATLDLKPRGFGFVERGIGFYAPTSVVVLLSFFAQRRRQSGCYLVCLARAAESCARAQLNRQITVANQPSLAAEIVADAIRHYQEGEAPPHSRLLHETETESPWVAVCQDLEKEYEVPESWKALNTEAERHIRRALQHWLQFDAPDGTDEWKAHLKMMQRVHYRYFLAFSRYISDCILWHESDLRGYKDKFCSLDLSDYLRACAALLCGTVITGQRHDNLDHVRVVLGGIVAMCGLPPTYAEAWLEACRPGDDRERFSSEVSVRVYREMAEILELPRDAQTLAEATHYSKWNGVMVAISHLHSEYGASQECAEFCRSVLDDCGQRRTGGPLSALADSEVEVVERLLSHYAIASEAGFRMVSSEDRKCVLLWTTTATAERFLNKHHRSGEQVCTVSLSELLWLTDHTRADRESDVTHFMVNWDDEKGGRRVTFDDMEDFLRHEMQRILTVAPD